MVCGNNVILSFHFSAYIKNDTVNSDFLKNHTIRQHLTILGRIIFNTLCTSFKYTFAAFNSETLVF